MQVLNTARTLIPPQAGSGVDSGELLADFQEIATSLQGDDHGLPLMTPDDA